jgi:uncharacterized protein GlcG (DUF336 family)
MTDASRRQGVATSEYGRNIRLAEAKIAMAAAEAEAIKNGWPVVIVIVDTGARLVMLQRLDQAQIGSLLIAQGKAETAVSFKRPTKVFEEGLAEGGLRLRTLAMGNVMPIEGGLPLLVAGKIVGAIGVSGVQAQQDALVAEAGGRALQAAIS